ncbi:phosphopentomutase [Paenibacillus darwinianus]|uniref:Phosphopentomutase n=1 Tax=Paenibacillus darwinianus TaxID=1380763 RepID=A0A9W5S1T6_9BACL|nr:phosphopentomutase [Paenibacillus darwinianus]EXX88281.1 phosphopentomutase [Paenibacillus darwinianus]EXX88618.1 phosphopentomutase [Paenibacillus darwinianus]EXX91753.1 phosphopentomutase [Paenibacillus darwinianus]
MRFKRVTLIVLDSVGIGEMPDAPAFGDRGAHTLGHIAESVEDFGLPELRRFGLANIAPIGDWEPVEAPEASYGKMAEASVGKDTMTGHWEIAGLHIHVPFRTFPDGFPPKLISAFEERTGRRIIGNKPASGTEILDELGQEQMETGAWIVYTSADSVFQIAAHEEIIPLEELYRACEIARELTLKEPYAVGRVIARPYIGRPGAFKRTPNRHDYAVKPPEPTVLNGLSDGGFEVISVGKINDIFSGEGIGRSYPTKSNEDGIRRTIELMGESFTGLLFTNLVDFDSLYGHRRDPSGYASALAEFDRALPELKAKTGRDDLLIITADHGNDPVHAGTDHTREYVPLLVYNPVLKGRSLGVRATFADIAATLADNFGIAGPANGCSFLPELTD